MQAAVWRARWPTRLSVSTRRRPSWYVAAGNPASSQATAFSAQWALARPSSAAPTTSSKPSTCWSRPPTPSPAATWAMGRSRRGSNATTPGGDPAHSTCCPGRPTTHRPFSDAPAQVSETDETRTAGRHRTTSSASRTRSARQPISCTGTSSPADSCPDRPTARATRRSGGKSGWGGYFFYWDSRKYQESGRRADPLIGITPILIDPPPLTSKPIPRRPPPQHRRSRRKRRGCAARRAAGRR